MKKPVTPPTPACARQPARPLAKSDKQARPDGPPLTPGAMARSELGRNYWGEKQQRDLMAELAAAELRMEGPRRSWQAAQRRRREEASESWLRRRKLAQEAKAAAPVGTADGEEEGPGE